MLGSGSASTPRPQPSAQLVPDSVLSGSSVTWCPDEFMQAGTQPRRSPRLRLLADLFWCTAACVHTQCEGRQAEGGRFRLMVNFTLLSAVLLLSLTLMLLVLPVVLPPLPPPPPFLMLVPVVIFILLMLIAFVPSGFNAIVVSYVPQLDAANKRIPGITGVMVRSDADQHIFASNSHSLHQGNFNEIC